MHASSLKNTSDPLVSVIIPCFNHGRFVGEAIVSARQQTYSHVEILVVDDGSTEDIASIVKQFEDVRYIRQTNQGLSAARNRGLQACRGEYLVFLDADDRLLPGAVEAGLRCFQQHPSAAFVSGGYRRIDISGGSVGAPYPAKIDHDHYEAFLKRNYVGMHASVMYSRAILAEQGGFDPRLDACEDYDVYLRLSRQFPVACHSELIAEYRTYPGTLSGDLRRMLRNIKTVRRKQRPFINEARKGAYEAGRQYWNELYALPLLKDTLREIQRGQLRRAALTVLNLARDGHFYGTGVILQETFKRILPAWIQRPYMRLARKKYYPLPGRVCFGDLRGLTPLNRDFGAGRGLPVDRHYIESFLQRQHLDIRGRVLEIGDATYTQRFGADRVTSSDVLHVSEGNPKATLVGDLTSAEHVPSDTFDCAIVTQTLHLIFDHRAALRSLHRMLRPGGVLLLTVPGISQISFDEWAATWYWSFTPLAMQKLVAEVFGDQFCEVHSFGNVLAATAFLQGIAADELTATELAAMDKHYPCVITVRAVKAVPTNGPR